MDFGNKLKVNHSDFSNYSLQQIPTLCQVKILYFLLDLLNKSQAIVSSPFRVNSKIYLRLIYSYLRENKVCPVSRVWSLLMVDLL